MIATGNPEFPSRVVSIGNRKFQTDKNTPGTFMRTVPENVQLLAEFPSGLCLMVTSSTVTNAVTPAPYICPTTASGARSGSVAATAT